MGEIETAKRLCVLHNRWNLAFNLAIKYDLPDIALLFEKYNAELLNKKDFKKAIEVNVQAEYYLQAAGYTYKVESSDKFTWITTNTYLYCSWLKPRLRKAGSAIA